MRYRDAARIKKFLRDNLEIVVDFTSPHSSSDDQKVGLKFKGDKDCFTWETVYVPDNTEG